MGVQKQQAQPSRGWASLFSVPNEKSASRPCARRYVGISLAIRRQPLLNWSYERHPTSVIDQPEGLGATHFELMIDDCVLPYLSRENHAVLLRLLTEALECRDRRTRPTSQPPAVLKEQGLIGEIDIGDERITVSRVFDTIIIGGSKDWKFTLPDAEKLRGQMISA